VGGTEDGATGGVCGMKRAVSTSNRKGDAEKAFKYWLERKNEAKATEKKRRLVHTSQKFFSESSIPQFKICSKMSNLVSSVSKMKKKKGQVSSS
jgi:hypothetical protein